MKKLDDVTAAERKAHDDFYISSRGDVHPGFNFWLQHDRPGPYKRFRRVMDTIPARTAPLARPGEKRVAPYYPYGIGSLTWYAMVGYTEGVRTGVRGLLRAGLTKSQVLELLAFVFLWDGPRGMEFLANVTNGIDWKASGPPAAFPQGWKADPDAFKSGLDFSSPDLTEAEIAKLRRWYMDNEGEVPSYVEFLAKYRPDVLKAYRNRWENIFHELPKQFMPYLMIRIEGQRGFTPGVREGVLLGKHWGLTRDEVVEILCWTGFLYGSPGALSIAVDAVGEMIETWS